MWFPGAEKYFNQTVSPRVTVALGRSIVNQASLARLHPGIYQSSYSDKVTPSLLIRNRLQTHSKANPSDTLDKVVNAGGGAGGRYKPWKR